MFTKQQNRILEMVVQHLNNNNQGSAARVLSSLHRSALKQTQKDGFLKLALAYSIASHPDFII